MTTRVALFATCAWFGVLAIGAAAYAAWHRPPRPPVPDAMPEALEAERRVVYLIDDVRMEPGAPRICVCGEAMTKHKEAKR